MRKKPYLFAFLLVGAFALLALGFYQIFKPGHQTAQKEINKAEISQKLKALNMPFIENKGQTDPKVAYYAKTFGGSIFITKEGELVYSFPKVEKNEGEEPKITGTAVLIERLGKVKEVKGVGESPTKVSYFIGNDPSKWQRDITTFERVSLGEVYEGIRVELKAYGSNIEKLFYVSPNADPRSIRVELEGVKEAKVKESGELILKTELGDIEFTKPVAYQEVDGKRVYVPVNYRLFKDGEKLAYAFEVGEYDRSKELVIDPLLQATYLGGSHHDEAYAIVLDSSGNVYVAGLTYSTDFPGISGGAQASHGNSGYHYDAFVAKLSNDLRRIIQSTYLGGNGGDAAFAIALDSSGNVYVAGLTGSTNFPGTSGGAQASYGGGFRDAFVAKLSNDLRRIIQATYLGGSYWDEAGSIALDSSGNVYVAGFTGSTNFPGTSGGAQASYGGNRDAFVAKLSNDLRRIIQATYLGGSGWDVAFAIALDSSGNVYVAGEAGSTNFPGTSGGAQASRGGGYYADAFVAKLSNDLRRIIQATYLGGNDADLAYAIAFDSSGNVYVAGDTRSTDFPGTSGGAQATHGGGYYYDAFVAKLNSSLTSIIQATYLGGSGDDIAYAIAFDSSGNVYVAGDTGSTNFPGTSGGAQQNKGGSVDAFVAKLSNDLKSIIQATYLGGSYIDSARAIALDSSGNVYVAGYTVSYDFPGTSGGAQATHGAGVVDAFVAKLTGDLAGGSSGGSGDSGGSGGGSSGGSSGGGSGSSGDSGSSGGSGGSGGGSSGGSSGGGGGGGCSMSVGASPINALFYLLLPFLVALRRFARK